MNIRKLGWKRKISAFLAGVVFFMTPFTAKADEYWPEDPSISTPCAIVMEINSGAVLYEKNADEVNYPASITKVLTTLLALEYADLEEVVTFSDDAIKYNQGDTSHKGMGHGLGLPLVKRIVELSDGVIEVESQEGCGALFRVILPK